MKNADEMGVSDRFRREQIILMRYARKKRRSTVSFAQFGSHFFVATWREWHHIVSRCPYTPEAPAQIRACPYDFCVGVGLNRTHKRNSQCIGNSTPGDAFNRKLVCMNDVNSALPGGQITYDPVRQCFHPGSEKKALGRSTVSHRSPVVRKLYRFDSAPCRYTV